MFVEISGYSLEKLVPETSTESSLSNDCTKYPVTSFIPYATVFTLMRCSGVRLSDTELPPSVPHPNVKAIGKPVEIPVPPWLPPVLIRIREAGLLENLKIISGLLV